METSCAECRAIFTITDADLAFYKRVSPTFGGKIFLVPPPTLCPPCRLQRRLAMRNETVFYHRECSACRRGILSIYHEQTSFPVYCYECFWGDRWDAISYGAAFSFERSFFEQMAVLQANVPRLSFISKNCENSEYCNQADALKNCYLAIGSANSENCLYGKRFQDCRDCVDCLFVDHCELCYEAISCLQCYDVCHAVNCTNVRNARFVEDCQGSSNLLFCKGVRGASNRILNREVSKEEFAREYERVRSSPQAREEYRGRFEELRRAVPVRYAIMQLAERCTGNYITESQNAVDAFNVRRVRDVRYVQDAWFLDDAYDVFSFYGPGELCYEVIAGAFGFSRCLFTRNCWPGESLLHCDHCFNCKDCFGCIGLQRKQYCVLNKQYTKEEYEALVPKVIEHMKTHAEWGEFFPARSSVFAYNETVAQEHFPLTREAAERRGFRWKDRAEEPPSVEKIIPAGELPESIGEVPDDILQWAVRCEVTGKAFRIIKQELEFYRQMRLPVPRLHPEERQRRRLSQRNPRMLWKRDCMKCGKNIDTSFAPKRPEIIYCEECYLQTVY